MFNAFEYSGLRSADDIRQFLQKRDFCFRKPLFCPLNYGDDDRGSIDGLNGDGQDAVPLLRLDPMFDPLRNDPRFQKLVASPAPK